MKKIYVLCPYGLVTCGPDALHQIVYYLNSIGLDANLVYVDILSNKKKIPDSYKRYVTSYKLLKDINDSMENIVIAPETLSNFLNKFTYVKKYLWWLSVDNDRKLGGSKFSKIKLSFKKILKFKFYKILTFKNVMQHKQYNFNKECKGITHLCASYYAYDFVVNRTRNRVVLCIEPISLFYLEKGIYTELNNRDDVILYNPKKNYEFTLKIIKANPDLVFIPLINLNQNQLLNLFRTSKLYIDFGWFPGAERIPKEAVYNGCNILTGCFGASNFYQDVMIDTEYKIEAEEKNIGAISNSIKNLLINYNILFSKFDNYRNLVNSLESTFIETLSREFGD